MNEQNCLPELPKGWVLTTLGEIRIDESSGINPMQLPEEVFELYSVPSFEGGKPEIVQGKEIGSNKQIVEKDVVLLCKINPHINRVWTVGDFSANRKIASTEWISFYPHGAIDQIYLNYFFQNHSFRDYLIHNVSGVGGSLMRIKASVFADYPFLLPPLSEQARIVAKIEELFTKLDAGIDALRLIRKQIKRYRQAVLRDAVTGELTKAWREENRAELEPADALLKRILDERRARWEQEQQKKFAESGTPPKNADWKKKYKQPAAPETENLDELPNIWVWTFTQQLGEIQLGRQRSPKNRSDKFPTKYIRAANITEDGLKLDDVLDMDFKPIEVERYKLEKDDLILSEASGSPSQVGKPAIWKNELPLCCFQNTVIRLRPNQNLSAKFLLLTFKTYYVNGIFSKIAGGVGINHLSADKFSTITVALPPIAEQQKIVEEVERLLSVADAIEQTVGQSLKQAERLRQSILKRAFEGKLVPQDETDEPAEILLKRIKQEREKIDKSKKTNGKFTRKNQKENKQAKLF